MNTLLKKLEQIAIPQKKEILGNMRSISEPDQFLLQSIQLLQERNPTYVRHMGKKRIKHTSCQIKQQSIYAGKVPWKSLTKNSSLATSEDSYWR